MKTWLIINDLQIPFHDALALRVVLDFARQIKPYGIILNGDIIDAYQFSEFDKNPLEKATVLVEQRLARWLMGSLAPHATERWWLGGNHEDRLRRYMWKHAPKFAGLAELTFPALFHLGDHGFKWKEYGGHVMLGKLMVTHGSIVSKHSGVSGKNHLEKYGTSILHGHTHRLGVYYKRDVRGVHAAWENGCLCRLDPEYDQFPNWQHGISVVHVGERGFFSVQQLPIIDRRMLFYGRERVAVGRGRG